jgi:hypothetical protein
MFRQISAVIAGATLASTAAADNPQVRIFHGSPDAPNVDVFANGFPFVSDLGFESASSYQQFAAVPINFRVAAASAGPSAPVIEATLPLAAGTDYTVAAINTLSAIEPLVLVDDNTVASGESRVRFVHASPNAPAVDIALAGGGAVLFNNIEFRGVGDYITLPAGTFDLEVRVAGTSNVVLDIPGVELAPNSVYTAWATGLVGGSPSLNAVITRDVIPAPGAAALLFAAGGLLASRRRR